MWVSLQYSSNLAFVLIALLLARNWISRDRAGLPCSGQGHSSPGGCHRSGSPWPPSQLWRTASPSLCPVGNHRTWPPLCSCCAPPSLSTSPLSLYPPVCVSWGKEHLLIGFHRHCQNVDFHGHCQNVGRNQIRRRSFKLADILTECFSLHQVKVKIVRKHQHFIAMHCWGYIIGCQRRSKVCLLTIILMAITSRFTLIPPHWPHTTSLTSYHLTDQLIFPRDQPVSFPGLHVPDMESGNEADKSHYISVRFNHRAIMSVYSCTRTDSRFLPTISSFMQ